MEHWALTHPGCVRQQNQDTFKIEQLGYDALVCVVCDGMGGARSGNVASALASEVFVQEIRQSYKPELSMDQVEKMLLQAAQTANYAVYDQARQLEDFAGMGTTLVAAFLENGRTTVVNVGDSRAYCVTADGIRQISVDHSLVELMVRRGELTPEQARNYPGKNLITRAIGTEAVVECDIFYRELSRGDWLLLCTDGLTNLLDDQEILFEIAHGVDHAMCCQRLQNIALNRGAPDNVTSLLVRV